MVDNRASLLAQRLKRLPVRRGTQVQSLGREDPLEKEMATHSSILAWRIPWTEKPGRLLSTRLQIVGHNWAISLSLNREVIPGKIVGSSPPVKPRHETPATNLVSRNLPGLISISVHFVPSFHSRVTIPWERLMAKDGSRALFWWRKNRILSWQFCSISHKWERGSYCHKKSRGFPDGSVVKNLPANEGDTDLIPYLGRFHVLWSD